MRLLSRRVDDPSKGRTWAGTQPQTQRGRMSTSKYCVFWGHLSSRRHLSSRISCSTTVMCRTLGCRIPHLEGSTFNVQHPMFTMNVTTSGIQSYAHNVHTNERNPRTGNDSVKKGKKGKRRKQSNSGDSEVGNV